ncbi:protein extra-macrochaetae-like [Schistocerca gregaria]|uniref:protein extra-macrochaetae-like n=1 Tax=Schistocerca gregaria TaxID=7010 RepID=UPI00211F13BA|nr:protein extra-macrochaetae-like [Schistocerca gregaria]
MKCALPAVEALPAAAQRRREVQLYLAKLRRLLPAGRAPRRRRLSRLQVIHHVIDYICDLQHALLRHPAVASSAHVPCAPPTPPATPDSEDRLEDDEDLCATCSRQSSCTEEEMGPES